MRARLAAMLVVAMTASATAGRSITVFPLSSGRLPTALAKAPQKMTDALAKLVDAEVANVPIEDAAGLLDCDPEATACLDAVSKSVKAKRIVFGSISTDDEGGVKVTVTRFDPGPDRQQRTFSLTSTTADGMAEELARVAAPLFGKPKVDVVDRPPIDDPKDTDPGDPKDPVDDPPVKDTPHGAISGVTWGLIGGGGAVTALGVLFLVQASGLADDVNAAKRDTPDDFRRLTALEDKGSTRQKLGIAFTAVGAVAIAYGIYRAISERKAPASEANAMRITPVPLEDGAALVFTMGLP
ncbi:MAG: hypothetical protein ABI175_22425 [Polyangiales bacterium]